MSSSRTDRVPAEPFISWFLRLRDQKLVDFQRPPMGNSISGVGGPSRRVKTGRAAHLAAVRVSFNAQLFAEWCGLTMAEYETLRKNRTATVSLEVVDRVLTALDLNYKLNEWYPVEDGAKVA